VFPHITKYYKFIQQEKKHQTLPTFSTPTSKKTYQYFTLFPFPHIITQF
jgi:hypothetical protein